MERKRGLTEEEKDFALKYVFLGEATKKYLFDDQYIVLFTSVYKYNSMTQEII